MRYFADSERSLGKIFPGELRNDGVSFVRRLGKAFAAREGRRHGDSEIRVERAGKEQRAQKWRVVRNLPGILEFRPAEPETDEGTEIEPVFVAA